MGTRLRITSEQRACMLDFVKAHPALATGRFEGVDGNRRREKTLRQMAKKLNSCANGATKPPEKWLRSWQDWKSDVKKKSLAIRQHTTDLGPSPPPLTLIEEELMTFVNLEGMLGPDKGSDPQEESSSDEDDLLFENFWERTLGKSADDETKYDTDSETENVSAKRKKFNEEQADRNERLVRAMEAQATAAKQYSDHMGTIARTFTKLAGSIAKHLNGSSDIIFQSMPKKPSE